MLFFSDVRLYSSELAITEICIEDTRDGFPSWIELKNDSKNTINLKGHKILSRGKLLHEIKEDFNIKSGGYLIIAFYKSDRVCSDFEKPVPIGNSILNILNSNVFEEKLNDETFREDEFGYLNRIAFTLKLRDIKEIIGDDPNGAVEIENENDMYAYYPHCLSQCQPDLYKLYDNFAHEHCLKYKLPLSSKPRFIFSFFNSSLHSGQISMISPSGEEKASVSWTNGMYSKVQSDIKIFRDIYLIKAGPRYLGYERKWLHHSFSPFLPIISGYCSSPGKEQSTKPFMDLKLEVSDDNPTIAGKHELRLTFQYVASFLPSTWGYEFEISSDKEFKNVLFKKEEKPADRNPTLTHFYFSFTTADYENMILRNPKLYYRARRVLPDGYKTEWAGGECGELLRKRYTNAKRYKEFLEMEKYYTDEVNPRLDDKKRLEDELKRLEAILTKEKRKEKIAELRSQINEQRKKLDEATQEYKKHSDEYWRMGREIKRKYYPPSSNN